MSWFSAGADHLRRSGPSRHSWSGGPSTATQFATDGRGDQLWRGTTCGVTSHIIAIIQGFSSIIILQYIQASYRNISFSGFSVCASENKWRSGDNRLLALPASSRLCGTFRTEIEEKSFSAPYPRPITPLSVKLKHTLNLVCLYKGETIKTIH